MKRLLIKCNVCGGYHDRKIIKAVQQPGVKWVDYCPIYSFFDDTFGWRIIHHVDMQYDEKCQERQIDGTWERWVLQKRKAAYIHQEYDIVCPTCKRNHISFYNMPGECFSCAMIGEEL